MVHCILSLRAMEKGSDGDLRLHMLVESMEFLVKVSWKARQCEGQGWCYGDDSCEEVHE